MSNSMKNIIDTLERIISESSKIFIVGHNELDYDAIASMVGISELCNLLEKENYIVINDKDIDLEPGVKQIIDKETSRRNIITLEQFELLKDKNSSLITTDVNNKYIIPVKDYLDDFKNILVIDHHGESENSIKTNDMYIDEKSSSASEIVAELLNLCKIKYNQDIASYLLAGIRLDTKRFKKNTTAKTYDIAKKLIHRGANIEYVDDLFSSEFDVDKEISLLIHNNDNTKFYRYGDESLDEESLLFKGYNVSFTLNRNNPDQIYKKVILAQAADKMLNFRTTDAAFVIGYTAPNVISVSARSKGRIDVGEIMRHMQGGGNVQNAATKIENMNIFDLEKELTQQVEWGINIDKPKEKIMKIERKV